MWLNTMYVAIGGAIGAVARFWLVWFISSVGLLRFPIGVFVVNMIGCFLMGMLSVWLYKHFPFAAQLRYLILVGILGAFTTFSTFSLDVFKLLQSGHGLLAVFNVIISVVLGVILVAVGILAARFVA